MDTVAKHAVAIELHAAYENSMIFESESDPAPSWDDGHICVDRGSSLLSLKRLLHEILRGLYR
jgi:hypothetical protein